MQILLTGFDLPALFIYTVFMRGTMIFLLVAGIALFLFFSFQSLVSKSFRTSEKKDKTGYSQEDVRREQKERIEALKRRQEDLMEQRQRDFRMRDRF